MNHICETLNEIVDYINYSTKEEEMMMKIEELETKFNEQAVSTNLLHNQHSTL